MLLNRGPNTNTPLTTAIDRGCNDEVKLLLESSADVDSKNESGYAPLHLAAERGHQEIVETILTFGADINSRDVYGRTALHIATERRHEKVVVTLLNYGCDINIKDTNNHTPFENGKDQLTVYLKRQRKEGYNKYRSEVKSLSEVLETLMLHIVKLKAAKLFVSDENLNSVKHAYLFKIFSDLDDVYEEEIASLKTETICNTKVSFYDILVKGENVAEIYGRNENILQVLTSGIYKRKFPIYSIMIEKSFFFKCMERKKLVGQAIDTFHLLCSNLPRLPYECLENIFKYLNNHELKVLLDLPVLLHSHNIITKIKTSSRLKSGEKRNFKEYFKRFFKI